MLACLCANCLMPFDGPDEQEEIVSPFCCRRCESDYLDQLLAVREIEGLVERGIYP